MGKERSRRDVLKTGAGALAAVGTAGLAGCSGGVPFLNGGSSFQNWLHEPSEFRDQDHYRYTYIDPLAFQENESELPDGQYDSVSSYVEPYNEDAGVDFDETDWFLDTGVAGIAGCSRSQDELVEELENNDYNDETEYEGYQIFVPGGNENPPSAKAVNDNVILSVQRMENPVDGAEDLINVNNGDEPGYTDESEAMSTLLAELGSGSLSYGLTTEPVEDTEEEQARFEEMVGWGYAGSINGETMDLKWVYVHEDSDAVDTGDVEEWVDANNGTDQQLDDVDDIGVSQNGTAAVVTGTIETDELTL